MPLGSDNKDNNTGAAGIAKGVTSTVGNLVGGVAKTAGGAVGTVGQGLGDTINKTTGTQQVGDGLKSVTGGVDDGAQRVGKATEDSGEWKKP